jgi:hypothetical protein
MMGLQEWINKYNLNIPQEYIETASPSKIYKIVL